MADKIKKYNINFTQVSNVILHDRELSLKAKGLYAYLFSKPDDWQFHIPIMEKELKETAGQIRSIIKELITAGYIIRKQYNENGRFGGMIYEFVDPYDIEKIPCAEKTACGSTPTHNNIDNITNTEINNIFIPPCKKTDDGKTDETEKRVGLKKYGEFKNVVLTDDEVRKLIDKYGFYFQDAIEYLSAYIASNGKKYKNHYAVMKEHGWVWNEVHKNPDCGIRKGKQLHEDSSALGGYREETIAEYYKRTMGIDI